MLTDLQERIQQYMKEEQESALQKKDEKSDITPILKTSKKQNLFKTNKSIISNSTNNDQNLTGREQLIYLIKKKFGDEHSEDQYENVVEFLQKSYREEEVFNDGNKLCNIKNQLLGNLLRIIPQKSEKKQDKLQLLLLEQIASLNQMYKQKQIQSQTNFSTILENVQKQGALALLQGLSNKTYFQKKTVMVKKLNHLVDQTKQKELKLQMLYNKLQENVLYNFEEEVTQLKIEDKLQNEDKLWTSTIQKSMSKIKHQEILIDESIAQQNFDFSNFQSVLERKLLLERKLENSDKLLNEELNKNKVYIQKINNQIKDNLAHDTEIKFVFQQEQDLSKVVDDLEQFQYIESQRDHELQQINYISLKKLNKDKSQMDEILEKQKFKMEQEEIETQHILYNILQHVKKISLYKVQMKKIEKAKEIYIFQQEEVLQEFMKRQEEINILNTFQQLKKLETFKQNINDNIINEEGRIADEKKRLKAKQMLIDFRMQIYEIKTDEHFELIYSTKLMKDNMKSYLQKITEKNSKKEKIKLKKSSTISINFSLKFGNKKIIQKVVKNEKIKESESLGSEKFSNSFRSKKSNFNKYNIYHQKPNEKSQFKKNKENNESSSQDSENSKSDSSQKIEQTPLSQKLELYIKKKRNYDLFFLQLFKDSTNIKSEKIIQIYNQSSIMLTSLQQEFKLSEQEITKKTKEIPQLQKIQNFLQNEQEYIFKNVKMIPLDKEIIFENADQSSLISSLQSNLNQESVYYPISIEGQSILIEEISIRNNRIKTDTQKYQQIIESYFFSFKDFVQTFLQRISKIQQSVQVFIEVNKLYMDQFQETLNRYLAEKRIVLKENKNQKNIQALLKKKQKQNLKKQSSFMVNVNVKNFRNLKKKPSQQFSFRSKNEILDQISDESRFEAGGKESPTKVVNDKIAEQIEKQIQELPQQKQQLIDKFRYKLLHLFLEKLRQKEQHKLSLEQQLLQKDFVTSFKYFQNDFKKYKNPNFQRSDVMKKEDSLIQQSNSSVQKVPYILEDFDPVFRKSDFKHVRQNAINILQVEKFQKTNLDYNTNKNKLKLKLKQFHEKLNQTQNVFDIDQVEFLKDGKLEGQKQKQEMKLQKEMAENLNKKLDKKDILKILEKDLEKESQHKKITLKEQNQKVEFQIQHFLKKQKNNQLKSDLNKNKNNVLSVQRQEQFFIKDLKQKLSSRYQTFQNDFQKKYQAYAGQNSIQVVQKEGSGGQKETFRQDEKKINYFEQLAQGSSMKFKKQDQFENEEIKKINLSQEKRTQRLYTSLVQTTSNISEFKKKFNDNQLPQNLQNGLKIFSARKLNKSELNNQLSFRRILSSNGSDDEQKQIDLKQLSIVISKHFKESLKQRKANMMSQQNEYFTNDFKERSQIGSPFSNQQKMDFNLFDSQNFNEKLKKPLTSSLKQRIQINKVLTKSVHLKPRKEETPLQSPTQNFINRFPNKLQLGDEVKNELSQSQTLKNQIDDKIKSMLSRKTTNNNLLQSPQNTLTFSSDLLFYSNLQKDMKSLGNRDKDNAGKKKVSIYQNKSRNKQTVRPLDSRNDINNKVYTQNQSFNLTYNTLKFAKQQKDKKRVQISDFEFDDDFQKLSKKDYSSLFKY